MQNTVVWQNANAYNLTNNIPQGYSTIRQRRDFYTWYTIQIKAKGHEVVWPSMAYYISLKLRLIDTFPHLLLTSKKLKVYANEGSEFVFNEAFEALNTLFVSDKILIREEAFNGDKVMLSKEQFEWIERIYKTMDSRSIYKIGCMAKGKFIYSLIVPKAIRFNGDISKADDRYSFALNILRVYCKARIQ
jgi:hypothetical protein